MKTTKHGVYNPLNKDITAEIFDDNNDKQTLVAKALEITYFEPLHLANIMRKRVCDEILNIQGVKTNHEDEYNKLLNELSIDL